VINLVSQFIRLPNHYCDDYNLLAPLDANNVANNPSLASFQEASVKIESGVVNEIGSFFPKSNFSGAVISEDGYVLSAAHCFENCSSFGDDAEAKYLSKLEEKNGIRYIATVNKLSSTGELITQSYELEFISSDSEQDLALAKIVNPDANKFQFVGINEWENDLNSSVLTLSHPAGSDPNVLSVGKSFDLALHQQKEDAVSLARRRNFGLSDADSNSSTFNLDGIETNDVVTAKAYSEHGSSGGMLLNKMGDLIGVITRKGYYSPQDRSLFDDNTIMTISTGAKKVLEFLKKSMPTDDFLKL
jgi:S1-C subfamily serine protease